MCWLCETIHWLQPNVTLVLHTMRQWAQSPANGSIRRRKFGTKKMAFCWQIVSMSTEMVINYGMMTQRVVIPHHTYAHTGHTRINFNVKSNFISKTQTRPHSNSHIYGFRATDCVNGTLLKDNALPVPFMNFTQFWKIYNNSNIVVDPTDK